MLSYSDILLTVDFDRTLTGPDSMIPQRNLDAIEYFMAQGGSFTVNTGRSTSTFWQYLDTIPVNAPFLLYNGSAAYEKGQLSLLRPIELDVWKTMEDMAQLVGICHAWDKSVCARVEITWPAVYDERWARMTFMNIRWNP